MPHKHRLKFTRRSLRLILLTATSLLLTLSFGQMLSATPLPIKQVQTQLIAPNSNLLQTAENLNDRGRREFEQGDVEAALNSWKQAELAYRQAPNHNENEIMGIQINQAQAMQALGQYLQAEKLLTKINQNLKTKPDSEIKFLALFSLGNVWRVTGKLRDSEDVLKECLNLAQALQSIQNVSDVQLSLGNTALAQAKRAQAVKDENKEKAEIQKALSFYKTVVNSNASPTTKLKAQLNLLYLLGEQKRWPEAENLWPQIKDNVNQLPDSPFAIEARINLVSSLLKIRENSSQTLPDQKEIYQILQTALQQAKRLRNGHWESYALGSLGSFYEANEQYSEALEVTEKALILAQSKQAWDIVYQWQWQLGRLYNVLGDRKSAIAFYETAVNSLQFLRQNLAAIDLEGQFSFRDDVEPVYRELVDLLLQPEGAENEPSQENLKKARKVIESLQLAEIENFFREACLQAKPEQIDDIIDKSDPTAAVIYPIILRDRLEVILKLPNKPLRHNVTRIRESEVEETVKQLRKYLKEPDRTKKVKELSERVYDWLIAPFETDLEIKIEPEKSLIKTLVFVLDGELRNIPMSALYDSEKYLIERYAIALTSGLQLLDPKPIPQGQIDALIAGATNAPSFEKEGFGSLPNVREELDEVAKQLRSSRELTNEKFLKTNFQNQLELATFSIVHLATHGKFSSDPDRTFILAWDGRLNIKELDNLLRLSDRNGSNTIELLVLSACQTALGDKRAALGLAGVAARAGARSTVATLWQVYDRSTAKLMIEFYKNLFRNSNKLSKAEALRQAQLSLLTNPSYKAPYYWSAFILLGNWF
ncbi:CHAT domain-containing protein [Argonema galeatum]|uniref:CHAT domain-containing protein n=1 Tax=Argonema galeatum TaxID=2942762 RepID=UPI00201156E5|nr:CHAT domain-containing protein [Argonema galeatum]MCL1466079.1 CHAT domain-containing protein [Argonema galeatum A003/A1]